MLSQKDVDRRKRLRSSDTDTDPDAEIPTRACEGLFACHATLTCALKSGCVPCAYKIGCFEIALDKAFCKNVPNQRPEMCPRSSNRTGAEGTLGYSLGMNVLTVGDGDFSFSLAVARMTSGKGLEASSYESKKTLLEVYPGIQATMDELESLGAKLFFQVDATNIQETLPSATKEKYDRIVWNFPCEAVKKGQDGQNKEMDRNKDLVRRFVENARTLLVKKTGQIHINHKTKPPFNQWKIQDVALESSQKHKPRMCYYGRVVFDRYTFPGYVPRKALDKKSFPSHDACTYVFGLDKKRNPLTLAVSQLDEKTSDKKSAASSLVDVDKDLILKLRSQILEKKSARRKRSRR